MPQRLEKLKLTAFRGASEPAEIVFDKSLPACMVFGENGTGKSCIVDAIDFVCNGKLGSLEFRRLGSGQRKERFVPCVGKGSGDVHVELAFAGAQWSATLGRRGAELCNTPNRPRAWILRRPELLGFVEAEPAERYRQLASYIAVREIEQAEAALRDANNGIDRQVNDAVRATEQAQAALQDFWQREGSPPPSRDEWARAEAAKDVSALTTSVNTCCNLVQAGASVETTSEARTGAQQRAKDANDGLAAAEKAVAEAAAALAVGATELLQILRDTQTYLTANPAAEECPVCERPIDAGQLSPRISERIGALDRLDKLVRARESARKTQENEAAKLAQAHQAFLQAARNLAEPVSRSALPEITALAIDWARFGRLADSQVPLDDPTVAAEADALLAHVDSLKSAIQKRLDADQKSLNQLNAIKQHVQTIDTKTTELAELTELQRRAKETLRTVEVTRKSFVDGLLQTVSGEVDALYTHLHPGEAIGGLRLYLDPNQRGSLKFEGKFETETATLPQAYYSESHLDTLGVCIFLALAKKFVTAQSFVVMDDVFTSVDQVHLDRLVKLIHDQADQFNHLILTTHYRPWRDAYRYNRAPGLRVQLIELLPWTFSRGIRHTKTKLVVEDLTDWLNQLPLERQVVASKAGILLEGLLDHLTLLYECRVPRRGDQRYTLGDLLDAIDSRLKKALKVVRPAPPTGGAAMESELKPLLDGLGSIAWIRNEVGCHFNLDANIGDTDVKRFGEKVRDLANVMVCEKCGELPRSETTGTDRKCRCGHVRMQPVTAPQ